MRAARPPRRRPPPRVASARRRAPPALRPARPTAVRARTTATRASGCVRCSCASVGFRSAASAARNDVGSSPMRIVQYRKRDTRYLALSMRFSFSTSVVRLRPSSVAAWRLLPPVRSSDCAISSRSSPPMYDSRSRPASGSTGAAAHRGARGLNLGGQRRRRRSARGPRSASARARPRSRAAARCRASRAPSAAAALPARTTTPLRGGSRLAPEPIEEVLREQRNVLAPLAQRRQPHRESRSGDRTDPRGTCPRAPSSRGRSWWRR